MAEAGSVAADDTALRVALWRALHVQMDDAPHVFEDVLGLQLAAPEPGWERRRDMSAFTRPFRASIVARARFVEDLLQEQMNQGLTQYVILGAGLDTFAQRRAELAARLQVFEVDQPAPQAWKCRRLTELSWGVPPYLHLVPVDFEKGEHWTEHLLAFGYDARRPSLISSMGVSMYLSKKSVTQTLNNVITLATGTTLVMSFMLPIDRADPDVRPGIEAAARGAKANGTPWVSFFDPEELLNLAQECGFRQVTHISAEALAARYFSNRSDGLRPSPNSEELLLATV